MTRKIYFVSCNGVATGPFPTWREATEAWRTDITSTGDRGWAWEGEFEEYLLDGSEPAARAAADM
jgi:hypothetical protein